MRKDKTNKGFFVFNNACKDLQELPTDKVGEIFLALIEFSSRCEDIDILETRASQEEQQEQILQEIKAGMSDAITRYAFSHVVDGTASRMRTSFNGQVTNRITSHVKTIKRCAERYGERKTIENWQKENGTDLLKEFAERIVYGEPAEEVTSELLEVIKDNGRKNRMENAKGKSNAGAYKPFNQEWNEDQERLSRGIENMLAEDKKEYPANSIYHKLAGADFTKLIMALGNRDIVNKVIVAIDNDTTVDVDNIDNAYEFILAYE